MKSNGRKAVVRFVMDKFGELAQLRVGAVHLQNVVVVHTNVFGYGAIITAVVDVVIVVAVADFLHTNFCCYRCGGGGGGGDWNKNNETKTSTN